MIKDTISQLSALDPEIGAAVEAEYDRQRRGIELIASENVVSEGVLLAAGTILTNKYAEGYPARRYYGGCQCVDVVENIAIDRACKLFGSRFANVQPHSGSQANTAVYVALLQAGDTVLGMSLAHGGHLTHGSPVNFSGKNYKMVSYGVDPVTHRIDYDLVQKLAEEHRPKMIIAGASAYPREIDFARFSEIAKSVGAYLWVDMAHIAGLVAGGATAFDRPIEDAEDSPEEGRKDLSGTNLKPEDIVIGIAASGRTPYVLGGLALAKETGCHTVSIVCNANSPMAAAAELAIEVFPGPECVTGSTRLKAGTCQKLILNMISTAVMVGCGKTYGNLMVDVDPCNAKLVVRARGIVMEATGCNQETAEKAMAEAGGHAKTAITMILADCSAEEARARLQRAKGHVREAIR